VILAALTELASGPSPKGLVRQDGSESRPPDVGILPAGGLVVRRGVGGCAVALEVPLRAKGLS
jgi:hypothetical protein